MVFEYSLKGRPVIALLTDFGTRDAYVGVMKGVILSRAPDVQIVDLSHEVTPQAMAEAAFLLETAWRFFPRGSVFIVVVDPGVGTTRQRLAIAVEGRFLVGPDNGVLSGALSAAVRGQRRAGEAYSAHEIALPDGAAAVSVENGSLFLYPRSATFAGRDVFAPVAAHLASGGSLPDLGPRVERLLAFPAFEAPVQDGVIDGLILHVDHFGNLITDILAADLPPAPTFQVAGRQLQVAGTYGDAKRLVAIAGSSGYIEITMPNGSAAKELGAGVGERVVVTGSTVSPSP